MFYNVFFFSIYAELAQTQSKVQDMDHEIYYFNRINGGIIIGTLKVIF